MGSLNDLIQFIFAGLTVGAIYALVALGFGVVHNTMGIVNFTQVDFVSLGGMVLYTSLVTAGLPMAAALLLAIVGVTLVAILVEETGLRPSRSESHLVLIFLTIGLSIILRGAMKLIWGKNRMAVPPLSGEEPVHLLGATILPQTLWILALTALAIIGLVLFFRKTAMGLAMRGVAANPEAAAVVGLRVRRVKAMSFALAGALGGLAGCLVTPITTLSYDVGVLLGLKGFAAAILGGFGSFPGAILGGLALGLMESLGAAYLSSAYKDVTAFIVLLLVLFIRPRGLLGGAGQA
jgi:branched-chain amino acid transport system permease protein